MPQRLRGFISSPGDVPDERLRSDLVIDKLAQEYSRFFSIASYRWEHEPMLASGHFQDAIDPPSAFDIVILILWSRLGTPLPEKAGVHEYKGLDGRAPVTGTEWEYEDALAGARCPGNSRVPQSEPSPDRSARDPDKMLACRNVGSSVDQQRGNRPGRRGSERQNVAPALGRARRRLPRLRTGRPPAVQCQHCSVPTTPRRRQ